MLLKEIVEAREVLKGLAAKNCKPQLAYTIMKILKDTEDSASFYIKTYREIMDECAEKESDGSYKIENGLFILKDDCIDKFNKKMSDLCSITVDDVSRKIKLSDLDESLSLTPNDMCNLDVFIVEE